MQQWITAVMEQFGYFGVFLLILLENVFPPIPSEVILTFGGFMVTKSHGLSYIGMLTASTLGALAGAVLLYYVGKVLGLQRIERLVERYGRILRLTTADVRRADSWFSKYGGITVFLCRFVPVVRSLISIPAGMNHMKLIPFIIYSALGTLIWNGALIYSGVRLGENWEQLLHLFDTYSHVLYVVIGIMIMISIVYLRKRKL
ncbi:DedA family protein [Macrococcus equipercicus]|uniref:DedA family protein n=1 Tax=Macrococcus equipercicus TaxID=69967 RepID=A0A9Q9BVV9_9STAP|nr:DedA family protein [Macrococcus equipercicus]KAA1039612.1 DedA family protein [Macrococcus equipercicus]UTH13943.1 DedA family protein [Macrococcus equipercicus]